jgi:hypothetical protein
MYHPDIWGIAELEGNRNRNYAFNASLWGYLALILSVIGIGWLAGGSCLLYAVGAILAIAQWLGAWKNVTMLWAQRYASLFSVFGLLFMLGVLDAFPDFQFTGKCLLLAWYTVATLKDMEMYRNFYTFFLSHAIKYPFNQNAHWYSTIGLNNQAILYYNQKDKLSSLMNDAFSCACGFHWVLHNKKPDLIHDFLKTKIDKKPPIKVNYED